MQWGLLHLNEILPCVLLIRFQGTLVGRSIQLLPVLLGWLVVRIGVGIVLDRLVVCSFLLV